MLNRFLNAYSLFIAALLAALALPVLAINSQPELLESELAFQFTAKLDEANPQNIWVSYKIADGYYMYRKKIRLMIDPSTIKFSRLTLPKGKVTNDLIFGKVEIYRKELRFMVKLAKPATTPIYLTVVSQGCADVGVCYQPMQSKIRLSTAPDAAIEAGNQPLSAILKRAPPRPAEPL